MEKTDYTGLKLKELQELAKEKGLKNITKLKKDELIACLAENQGTTEEQNDITYTDPVRRTNLMSGVLEVLAF